MAVACLTRAMPACMRDACEHALLGWGSGEVGAAWLAAGVLISCCLDVACLAICSRGCLRDDSGYLHVYGCRVARMGPGLWRHALPTQGSLQECWAAACTPAGRRPHVLRTTRPASSFGRLPSAACMACVFMKYSIGFSRLLACSRCRVAIRFRSCCHKPSRCEGFGSTQ
jgi:hypothetical protein